MDLIYNSIFREHDTGMHPENRKRLDPFVDLPDTPLDIDKNLVKCFHTDPYVVSVREACQHDAHLDSDTVTSSGSYEAALAAVQATLLAAERGAFALTRPPGHHAHTDRASGFCLFNNVGIAAHMLADSGKKVLILDFDSHLGDGTVTFFAERPDVFYWSLHQFPAFPGGGDFSEIGTGPGAGFTMNMPLPPGTADDLFLDGINFGLPIAKQFAPDIVALSAGFDGHQNDLLLDLRLSTNAYYKLGCIVRENFQNTFATLEGGYNIVDLPRCLYSFVAGISGLPAPAPEPPTESSLSVRSEFDIAIGGLSSCMAPHWRI